MQKIKLAEGLLRRKELQQKVDQLSMINGKDLFEVKVKRMKVTDSVDEVTATVPKIKAAQVTAEYDHYAKQLRLVDAAIQQANWTAEIEVQDHVMKDYLDLHPAA